MQGAATSSLQILFRDDAKRLEIRRIIAEAFGSYFVIDPTHLGQLRIRLSDRPPTNDFEERGIHEEAVDFHRNAQPIELASDGVKAFVGMLCEIMAGEPEVFLVDEPEAFLHPSLASKLGGEVSRAAVASNKRLFASTHSPAFVMGCINSGASVNIIRLTYQRGIATSRLLPSEELMELMRNPLLRSTNVLNGLFYDCVIVTEGDADRAFYQEINERLLKFKPEWGIQNCLFVNAQNMHTIHAILKPLRKLGIPTVGITDIDFIAEKGPNWSNLIDASGLPEILHAGFGMQRSSIVKAAEATGSKLKTEGGIKILPSPEQEAANLLLGHLSDYGIFVVPGGELESWLPELSNGGHGPNWLIPMFGRMGVNPQDPAYVKPGSGDVWLFMSQIKKWLTDPNRKGIPA